jgi:putative DNA primase/helicase
MAPAPGKERKMSEMQKLSRVTRGRNSASALSWNDVARIAHGRLGRTMAACPLCSDYRSTPHKRRSEVLAVTLQQPDFAVYYCNHCEAQGYAHPETSGRVIDFAEQQGLRNAARQHAETDRQRRIKLAIDLWNRREAFRGSVAETYLHHGRNIGEWLDTFPYLDKVLGFHPSCPFGNERHPAMLALVREIRTNAPVAVHRTALKLGKYPERIGRKSLGPTRGGAIKISPDHEVTMGLMIGEGIETVLAASRLLHFKPVWSLIDKGNLAKFPVLPGIESITLAIDNDESGDGQRAADECIKRLNESGVQTIPIVPNGKGDFNDVLRGRKNVQ